MPKDLANPATPWPTATAKTAVASGSPCLGAVLALCGALGASACSVDLAAMAPFPCGSDDTCPAGFRCEAGADRSHSCLRSSTPDAGPGRCGAGETACPDRCLPCGADRAHCGTAQPSACCSPTGVFCDVPGPPTGCFEAGTDCLTITRCGPDWFGCLSGGNPGCSSEHERFCCTGDYPKFCDVPSSPECTGCWNATADCSRPATYCADDRLCHSCVAEDKHYDCVTKTCVPN